MNFLKDETVFNACFIAAMTLLVLACKWGWSAYSCESRAKSQDLKGEYGVMSGCVYVLPDKRKILEDKYRVVE